MYKIGIISDTRITVKEQPLPAKVLEIFTGVDRIIHAGNICKEWVLEELETLAPVDAVRGVLDNPADFTRDLPESKIVNVQGYTIAVHNQRPDINAFKGKHVNVLVSGNTCIPKLLESEAIPLLLDPGSPTVPSKHGRGTVMLLKIDKLVYSYIMKV